MEFDAKYDAHHRPSSRQRDLFRIRRFPVKSRDTFTDADAEATSHHNNETSDVREHSPSSQNFHSAVQRVVEPPSLPPSHHHRVQRPRRRTFWSLLNLFIWTTSLIRRRTMSLGNIWSLRRCSGCGEFSLPSWQSLSSLCRVHCLSFRLCVQSESGPDATIHRNNKQ